MKRFLFTVFAVLVMLLITSPAHAQNEDIGWNVNCDHTKFDYIDPIVYPYQYPAGHLHEFFGTSPKENWTVPEPYRTHGTNCNRRQDTSGYWVPTLHKWDGTRIKPVEVAPYYRTDVWSGAVHVPPAGLRMIAGSSMAQSPQDLSVVHWDCKTGGVSGGAVYGYWPEPHNCNGNTDTPRVHINFPQCWDGANLDSADHQSHMTYPLYYNGYYCPQDHPVAIPKLSLQLAYPSRADGGGGDYDFVYFDSGGRYSEHADWFQAWRDDSNIGGITALVSKCFRQARVCGNDFLV